MMGLLGINREYNSGLQPQQTVWESLHGMGKENTATERERKLSGL